jgi:hypothetical protein
MRYALLLYDRPHVQIPETEREATLTRGLAEIAAWQQELVRAGVFRSGLRLAPAESATSLRAQGGEVLLTDGPFAQTKEILGGLVVLECADLDEALRFARRCPVARFGTVEVRPEWSAALD